MADDYVYSVRMRAAAGGPHEDGGRHVSGAERLVDAVDVADAVSSLTRRAMDREAETDFVRITIDRLRRSDVETTQVLKLRTTPAMAPAESISHARLLLVESGIAKEAVDAAFAWLMGSTAAGALRGARLVDSRSGADLTPDAKRGVRASRFDYAPGAAGVVEAALSDVGLTHFRTREALALATKVIWAGVAAELCWSDEHGYVAGYVATPRDGYVRYADFKPAGAVGGRIFFIDRSKIRPEPVVDLLERQSLWITGPLDILRMAT